MFKKVVIGLIAIVLVIIAWTKVMPVGDTVDPTKYFDEFKDNEYNLVYEDKRIDIKNPVKLIDGNVYINNEVIKEYLDTVIFYDEAEKVMTVTDVKNVLRLYPNSDKALLNGKEVKAEYSIKEIDNTLYVPADLLKDKAGIEVTAGKKK